ncbi:hypothetical protein KC8_16120 [Sphingomonas sp. KC8]|nr:hypothetical protein KC8_16120 [Sphingomonas sp. KC8]
MMLKGSCDCGGAAFPVDADALAIHHHDGAKL